MSGVKGQRPLGPGRSWEVRTHLTKEEWKKMHEIAEDNGMSTFCGPACCMEKVLS